MLHMSKFCDIIEGNILTLLICTPPVGITRLIHVYIGHMHTFFYELHCVGLKRSENKLDRRNAFMILEGNQVVFSLCSNWTIIAGHVGRGHHCYI